MMVKNGKEGIQNMFSRKNIIIHILLLFLFVLVLILGKLYQQNKQNNLKTEAQYELKSIANTKIDGISQWYEAEITDAQYISKKQTLIKNIETYILTGLETDHIILNEIFLEIKNEHNFDNIMLLSPDFHLIYPISSSKKKIEIEDEVLKSAKESRLNRKPTPTDLIRKSSNSEIYLHITTPVYNEFEKLISFLVFKINPEDYLFPFIKKWPFPSKTAETLILRKDGDSILFLNELKHVKGTALNLHIPLTQTNVPAVQAVLGNMGVYEGFDYRDVKVVSYVNKIPRTPWFIVAKVDQDELYNNIKWSTFSSITIISLLVIFLFLIFAFIYSQSQKNSYKALWLSQEEFKTTLYSIGDGVISTNGEGLIKHMNPVAEKLTGWKEHEAINKPVSLVFNIINEVTLKEAENPFQKIIEQGKIIGLSNHTLLISKAGKHIPISDSGAPIFNEKAEIIGVILVFRDQSVERNLQKKEEEQKRKLFTLMSNLSGMAYRCKNDRNWTMEFVSKGCMELTGYTEEDLIDNHTISYNDLIVPEDVEFAWVSVQEAIKKKVSFQHEYRIKDKSGKIKWLWEKGQGVYDEEGNLIALEGFINDIDERKKVESALKENEQLFQNLTENATVGIFKTDKEGLTTYVNPEWSAITGLSSDEAKGYGWLDYVHPDDSKTLTANWNASIVKNKRSDAEYRYIKLNGEIVWVKGQAVPEYDEQNKLTGYIGTINNITETKKAESKLKNSNLLLKTLIDNIPDSIYLIDLEGRKLISNKADLLNIGVENEQDVIGKTDFDLFPKEIAEEFWKIDKKVLTEGINILNIEEVFRDINNDEIWISSSKIPYRNSEGKIIGLIGIGHDITRRKKDEEEKTKLLTILTQSPISIIITDTKANIEYVNPKFTEVTGYSPEEIVNKNPNIIKSGTQNDDFYTAMWTELTKGNEWKSEFHNKKKNGELFWENVIIAPIKNNRGEIVNYVAVKEDITAKKKMIKELIIAKNKAEEGDRLKTSFLANMSHEIRTPLNSIIGFTSILSESDDLDIAERNTFSSIIKNSGDSLLQIINDIIDISSLETGLLQIVNSSFNPFDLVNELFVEFNKKVEALGKSNIQLKMLEDKENIQIKTDRNRLNQIFINLLTNSLKFTEKGYIEFGIERCDSNYIYFKVEDTGIGIKKEMHSVIFERFRQGEDTDTRHIGGNGLGLSIVKNLIELMGGDISLKSEIGYGSTFKFKLPIDLEKE